MVGPIVSFVQAVGFSAFLVECILSTHLGRSLVVRFIWVSFFPQGTKARCYYYYYCYYYYTGRCIGWLDLDRSGLDWGMIAGGEMGYDVGFGRWAWSASSSSSYHGIYRYGCLGLGGNWICPVE